MPGQSNIPSDWIHPKPAAAAPGPAATAAAPAVQTSAAGGTPAPANDDANFVAKVQGESEGERSPQLPQGPQLGGP